MPSAPFSSRKREHGFFKAFEKQIAIPFQMQDFIARDGTCTMGAVSSHSVYALRMSTRDIARFGLLYLRNGKWRGRTVVPAAWVSESTTTHADIGGGQRVGLHVCKDHCCVDIDGLRSCFAVVDTQKTIRFTTLQERTR